MADKLGLNPDIRELKLGSTFTNGSKGSSFHTLRYDFKPASMDPNEVAKLDVGASNQVTVTVPHGSRETVFKGSHKPYQKECVLIIDNVTGEITLEKLSNNIQLKKTRTAPTNKADTSHLLQALPSLSRLKKKTAGKANNNHKTKSSSNNSNSSLSVPPASIPRHSPLQTSPSYFSSSPNTKSPTAPFKSPSPRQGLSPMVNCLPALGLDDIADSSSMSAFAPSPTITNVTNGDSLIGEISETSSSSSSSSDSDSDSSSGAPPPPPASSNKFKMNGKIGHSASTSNGQSSPLSVPELLLNEDLQLSESSGSSDSE